MAMGNAFNKFINKYQKAISQVIYQWQGPWNMLLVEWNSLYACNTGHETGKMLVP